MNRVVYGVFVLLICPITFGQDVSEEQLARLLKRFPAADTNKDGTLTKAEALAYRNRLQGAGRQNRQRGVPTTFAVDPGWKKDRFPEHAVCYRSAEEILDLYTKRGRGRVTSYEKPSDGSLRIVGTGHSFMAPGFQSFPRIAEAAGMNQPPLMTHTGGGITGSARYKWEQENGIFQFDKQPTPKLLAAISNGEWDAMMWGPYYNDQPEYYSCWIDFCLKYNPDMKFYLSDAWPQLGQLKSVPDSEQELTDELFAKLEQEKRDASAILIAELNKKYDNRVFVLPTSKAMVLAVKSWRAGRLPGIDGIHKVVGGKTNSLWRDKLGHLGPKLAPLEGYVFYATMYGTSPEKIENPLRGVERELDNEFRRIAWQAVIQDPLSGVKDMNKNGLGDHLEAQVRTGAKEQ